KLGDFEPVKTPEKVVSEDKPHAAEAGTAQQTQEHPVADARYEAQQQVIQQAAAEKTAEPPKEEAKTEAEKKWYDKFRIGGYTQFRQSAGFSGDLENLTSPGDRSIEEDTNYFIRRARLVFQGDITDHLKIYMQTEFAGGDVAVRDMYG